VEVTKMAGVTNPLLPTPLPLLLLFAHIAIAPMLAVLAVKGIAWAEGDVIAAIWPIAG